MGGTDSLKNGQTNNVVSQDLDSEVSQGDMQQPLALQIPNISKFVKQGNAATSMQNFGTQNNLFMSRDQVEKFGSSDSQGGLLMSQASGLRNTTQSLPYSQSSKKRANQTLSSKPGMLTSSPADTILNSS